MKKTIRNARTGSEKYVRIAGKLFLSFVIVMLVTLAILFVLALNTEGIPKIVYSCSVAGGLLLFFVAYGFYFFRVSLGTVIAYERTDLVVHLHTKRKVFTYDSHGGCVDVKVKHNRYVCTFITSDSKDSFLFYRHAPFSKYSDGQFTEADIRSFCPGFDGEDYHVNY